MDRSVPVITPIHAGSRWPVRLLSSVPGQQPYAPRHWTVSAYISRAGRHCQIGGGGRPSERETAGRGWRMVLAESTLRLAPILPVLPHDTPSPTPLPPESPGVREHRGLQLVLPQLFAYLGKIASPAEFLHPPFPLRLSTQPPEASPTSNNRPHRQPPLISSLSPARLVDIVNCTFRLPSASPDIVHRRSPSRPNPPRKSLWLRVNAAAPLPSKLPPSLPPSPFRPPRRPQCLLESYVALPISAAAQLPGAVSAFCGISVDPTPLPWRHRASPHPQQLGRSAVPSANSNCAARK